MEQTLAREEYLQAQKAGLREYKELTALEKSGYPAVLDQIFPESQWGSIQDIGLLEIPAHRIIGTKSKGRICAFSAGFLPLLDVDSEFAAKWINLCSAHLSDTGIRDPIVCFEYLGNFYVQEGNKRVGVLKHFGAAKIPAIVRRLLPPKSDDPRIVAYYEFMDFYKVSKLYDVQFTQPGDYEKLLSSLGKEPGEAWTDREQRTFSAYFYYFRQAFSQLGGDDLRLSPEEAMLIWLTVYPFRDLGQLSDGELKKSLSGLWEDILAAGRQLPVYLEAAEPETKSNLISRLISPAPSHLHVAFVHQLDPESSPWIKGHYEGGQHLQKVFPDKVTVTNYFHANTPEERDVLLDQAVKEGADVVFTTSPMLSKATVRAALKYPKVRFLNCAVSIPHSGIRTYYSRVYEGKFITGAIAGAMANDDAIGYVGSYPILGVPASINAFALGAQMTNPRAKVQLRWSCTPGNPVETFIQQGIRVISNRDIPTQDKKYLEFGEYGTYEVEDDGSLTALASPFWQWGSFYERLIQSILDGHWNQGKHAVQAVNYWWGMDSNAIDVAFSEKIPDGVRVLAQLLRSQLQAGTLQPFNRRIVAQDGRVMNDGNRELSMEELLHMDWLCDNVVGSIPAFDELLPISQPLVRQLGVYRDQLPPEKEAEGL